MSGKLPYLQFYPTDWLADPGLRSCSLAARGLWIDMLCIMHCSPRRGFLLLANGTPVDTARLAQMSGCAVDEAARLLGELETSGVFSRDAHTILSRRMTRDEHRRTDDRERKRHVRSMSAPCPVDVRSMSGRCPPDIPEARSQRPEKDTPQPPAEPGGGGGRSAVDRSATFDRAKAVRAIVAAFPACNSPPSPRSVEQALYALSGPGNDARFPSEADAAAWLMGRVAAWAGSALCRSTPEQYRGAGRAWFTEAKYDTPDEVWAVARATEASATTETPDEREVRLFRARKEPKA